MQSYKVTPVLTENILFVYRGNYPQSNRVWRSFLLRLQVMKKLSYLYAIFRLLTWHILLERSTSPKGTGYSLRVKSGIRVNMGWLALHTLVSNFSDRCKFVLLVTANQPVESELSCCEATVQTTPPPCCLITIDYLQSLNKDIIKVDILCSFTATEVILGLD